MGRLTPSQPEAGSVGRQWQRHEAEWASEGVEGRLRSLRAEYLLSLRESPSLVLVLCSIPVGRIFAHNSTFGRQQMMP